MFVIYRKVTNSNANIHRFKHAIKGKVKISRPEDFVEGQCNQGLYFFLKWSPLVILGQAIQTRQYKGPDKWHRLKWKLWSWCDFHKLNGNSHIEKKFMIQPCLHWASTHLPSTWVWGFNYCDCKNPAFKSAWKREWEEWSRESDLVLSSNPKDWSQILAPAILVGHQAIMSFLQHCK